MLAAETNLGYWKLVNLKISTTNMFENGLDLDTAISPTQTRLLRNLVWTELWHHPSARGWTAVREGCVQCICHSWGAEPRAGEGTKKIPVLQSLPNPNNTQEAKLS